MSTRTRTAALVALVATAPFLLVACGDGGDGRDGRAGGIPEDATYDAADVRFAARMVPHHEQALEMVDIAAGRDLSPAVADLVERIGAAQAPEVARMQGWLEQWADDEAHEADEADEDGHMGDGMGHGMGGMDDRMDDHMDGDGMHGDGDGDLGDQMDEHMDGDHMGGVAGMTGMPGMASPAELAALEAARGRAFERMWLAVMVQHHEGAIAMAEQELEQGEDPAALDLARSITASQQAEVDEMRDLLDR